MLEKQTDRQYVAETIARVFSSARTVPIADVLAGKPFLEIDRGFDSLVFFDLQLHVERELELDFELAVEARNGKIPMNVYELADAVVAQVKARAEES